MKQAKPKPKFRVGDRVIVAKCGPIGEFPAVVKSLGLSGYFGVVDGDGREYRRREDELSADKLAPRRSR